MIICVGEILADMIAKKTDEGVYFGRYAGGAPFNVACGIAKLGGASGFYGCVGKDLIGEFLVDFAMKQPLSYCNIIRSKERNTTLAFVELNNEGDRKFCFYRKHTADYHLREKDIEEIVEKADIVHLGSLPMSESNGRKFYDKLISYAREKGKKISFDVNYRDDIFPDEEVAKEIYLKYIAAADIVKLSQEELLLFTAETDILSGMEKLAQDSDKVVFVTLGSGGSAYFYKGHFERTSALPVQVKDTTGAGDAFFAGVLSEIDKHGFDDLKTALLTGSICGSLTTQKKGAIDAFPTKDEVEKCRTEII